MFTRKQYLAGECTHEQYYGQYVNDEVRRIIKFNFTLEELSDAYKSDPYLNNIPLKKWDILTEEFGINKSMEKRGDYATLAGKVCILKEAARQLVKKFTKKEVRK